MSMWTQISRHKFLSWPFFVLYSPSLLFFMFSCTKLTLFGLQRVKPIGLNMSRSIYQIVDFGFNSVINFKKHNSSQHELKSKRTTFENECSLSHISNRYIFSKSSCTQPSHLTKKLIEEIGSYHKTFATWVS